MVDFNFEEYCTLEVSNTVMAHVTHDINSSILKGEWMYAVCMFYVGNKHLGPDYRP